MNRITKLVTLDNDPKINELREFISKQNQYLSKIYNDVLKESIENHLGRPLNIEEDVSRIHAVSVVDSNVTSYFVDDILIGTLTTEWDYNGTDFMDNKISYRITFKSNQP